MKFISHTAETAMESVTFVYDDKSCDAWVDMEIVKRFSHELYEYLDTHTCAQLHIDDMFAIQDILFNSHKYFQNLKGALVVHVCRGEKHCKTKKNKNREFARLVDVVARFNIEDVRTALVDYIDDLYPKDFVLVDPVDLRLVICRRGEKQAAFEMLKSLRAYDYIIEESTYFIDQIAQEWRKDRLS
jgi:hypothetical protein